MSSMRGRAFNGGGGVDRAPWLDAPPKRAQSTEASKTNLGTFVVRMAVVIVFKATWSPVNSGYSCVYHPTKAFHENHMTYEEVQSESKSQSKSQSKSRVE